MKASLFLRSKIYDLKTGAEQILPVRERDLESALSVLLLGLPRCSCGRFASFAGGGNPKCHGCYVHPKSGTHKPSLDIEVVAMNLGEMLQERKSSGVSVPGLKDVQLRKAAIEVLDKIPSCCEDGCPKSADHLLFGMPFCRAHLLAASPSVKPGAKSLFPPDEHVKAVYKILER